jgi:release factor glutamine methyltransferase
VNTVYQAAEDSRLLADAAVEGIDDGLVCEVGVGSGYVAERVASETAAEVVGSDVVGEACGQARERGLTVVRGNLTDPFRAGVFDAVLFNPPYLPTPPEEEWDDPLERALSGGADGRRVVEPFLDTVGRVLVPAGRVFLLVSTLTDVDAVRGYAADRGLGSEVVTAESYPFERLVVLRLQKD